MPFPSTVNVILPLPLHQSFTYRVPEEMGTVVSGMRVLVPFGRRRLTGVVVEGGPSPDDVDYELKPLLDVLDEEPALTQEMLDLTRWMADYYVCGWGEVARAALPSGTDVKTRRCLERTEAPAGDWADHNIAGPLLNYLEGREEVTVHGARQQIGDVPLALVRRLQRDGLLIMRTELRDPQVSVKREKHLRIAPAFRQDGAILKAKEQLRGHKQVAVVEAMAGFLDEHVPEPRRADVIARADASYGTVRSLIDKGILESVEKEMNRSPLGDLGPPPPPPDHTLHPSQQEALDAIHCAIEKEHFEAFLLHGVTGSGKTVVYIEALKEVLARGQTGIILVPEIALTPQTVQRFRSHFGDRIAVLHSRMSLGERYDTWRHLRAGRYDVVIGPRSAILAPLSNIGLIVVDEEHESSYKQFEPAPRYHARDVAVMRAHMNDAVCVLGSATPSVESYDNAQNGKYTLLSMPERVPDASGRAVAMPEIQIIDLTLERKKHRLDGVISETLAEAIQERMDRSEQVILLQNRRGYAPVVECQDCGWTPRCRDCDVTMTYHKVRRHLRCHYCGRAGRHPQTCPVCDSDELGQLGTGTQRVEEELAGRFLGATVVRMDLDSTSRKNAHHRILEQFRCGRADILIGTQMVAKGLDFSRVTLVGVVNADMGLLLPDFRAEERTFQLLTQVAGRAGRAELRGEVLLQTRNPKHAVFEYVLQHDVEGFIAHMLPERQQFNYPPFARVAGVTFRGPNEQKVEQLATDWTGTLNRNVARSDAQIEVLGPQPAFISRIKKQYRYHTLVKCHRNASATTLQSILRTTDEACGSPPRGYHVAIDVDVVGLF